MEQDYVKTHNQDGLVLLSVGEHVFHPSASRSGEELSKLQVGGTTSRSLVT